MKTHSGGTLLGFVAGLLLGLGVALGVVLYVTKAPVPLLDRGVQRAPEQEAIEAERNKTWNPNSGLTSKPAPAAAPETNATASPPPPASPASDPLGELIQPHTGNPTPAAATEPEPDPFNYFVQAGAFRSAAEAEAQRARLAMQGFDAKVTEREQAGRPVFRVRLGPFTQRAEADNQQVRLQEQGVEAALVRVQR